LHTAFQVVLAFTTLALISCATGNSPAKNKLAGKWRSAQGPQAAEYVFAPDGTFRGRVTAGSSVLSDFTGKWSLREGVLFYEYTGDRLGRIPTGTLDQDKIIAIAQDFYLIEARDGSKRKYVRVPLEQS